jgi:hypothetical protein
MSMNAESQAVREIQSRIDQLMDGSAMSAATPRRSKDDERQFTEFLAEDRHRADAMAAVCKKIATRVGGISGLEAAVDYLFERLGTCPDGMVEHASKLFLTGYAPAKGYLVVRSLEERQPGFVQPS